MDNSVESLDSTSSVLQSPTKLVQSPNKIPHYGSDENLDSLITRARTPTKFVSGDSDEEFVSYNFNGAKKTTKLVPGDSDENLDSFFNGTGSGSSNGAETFSVNGEEVVVEPLEMSPHDGKDENCKHCQ